MAKGVPNRYPLPKDEEQYRIFLESVEDGIEKERYIEIVMEVTGFKHKYVEVITDNLIFYGFVDRNKGTYSLKSHTKKYLNKEIKYSFSNLCRDSIDLIDLRHTSIIDFILDVLKKLPSNERDSVTVSQIYESMDADKDPFGGYEFAKKGRYTLREIIRLLLNSKYIKELDGKYWHIMSSSEIKKLRRKSRRYSCEEVLNTLGDDYPSINNEFKVALSKYHVYWHSRGIGKLRGLSEKLESHLNTLHQELYSNYKSRYPGVRKSPSAWETSKRYKAKLASTLRKKYNLDDIESLSKNLSWKTVSLLEKIVDGDFTLEEFKSLISKSGNKRFDRSILDDTSHKEGLFQFNSDIKPHKWQEEAVNLWQSGSDNHVPYYGIISAVTGSGKTVAAMLAVNKFIQNNSKGIVSVIVPTKVLMKQWAEEFSKILGLGSNQIGICGDGFKDSFLDGKRVVISIINSAIRDDRLKNNLDDISSNIPHLLIADECHRYGGGEFAKVFNCRKDATLGLSATPPSEVLSDSSNPDMNAVISALGKQFYKLSYKDAREQKLICEFTVKFVGVELENNERVEYDNLSKKLSKALERIRMIYGHRIEAMPAVSLDQKLNMIIISAENPDKSIYDYFDLTRKRRNLIYDATNRISVYNSLLQKGLEADSKIMVFHERIKQMEDVVAPMDARRGGWYQHLEGSISEYQRKVQEELEHWFSKKDFKPVMYHSKDSPTWNNRAMEWYRTDVANVMLSVKALVEGVDVPAADLGIVRVSSSSIRQRIQTIGRVLRKGDYNKKAEIWIVFVENTVDINMFKSYNWQEELGQSQIEYCHWDGNDFEVRDMEKLPVPEDYEKDRPPIEVDVSELKIGDIYPGRLAGDRFGVDARSVPFKNTRKGRVPIKNKNIEDAARRLHKIKGGGKIYLTPQGNFITKVKRDLIFLGSTNIESFRKDLDDSLNKKKKKRKSKSLEDLFS